MSTVKDKEDPPSHVATVTDLQPTRTRLVHWVGHALIFGLWLFAAYLFLYYAVLLYFGSSRLYTYLGGALYNALFPVGGFNLVLSLGVLALVWGAPVLVFGLLAGGLSVLVAPRWPRGSRARRSLMAGVVLTAALPWVSLDGWPDPLLPLVFEEDTEYAPTYDALGFWKIRRGMTPQEALATAGVTLKRYPDRRAPPRCVVLDAQPWQPQLVGASRSVPAREGRREDGGVLCGLRGSPTRGASTQCSALGR